MQIGTRCVPFWEFDCGELGKGAQAWEIDPVEATSFPEAMPADEVIQGAEMVHNCGWLWEVWSTRHATE